MMILRPDFTYITSVLQPAGGFDPVRDVMATTNAFTQAPMQFQNGGLGGSSPITFLGPNIRLLGPVDTIKAKWQLFVARMRAKWAAWGLKKRLGLGFTPYGPRSWASGHVVPMAAARQMMFAQMSVANLPSQFSPGINPNIIASRFQ